jgi:hypothetical protein
MIVSYDYRLTFTDSYLVCSQEADCRTSGSEPGSSKGPLKFKLASAFRHCSLVQNIVFLSPLMIPERGRVFRLGIFRARQFRTISLVGLPKTDILSHQWQKILLVGLLVL